MRTKKQNKRVERLIEKGYKITEETHEAIILSCYEEKRVSYNTVDGLHYISGTFFVLVDRKGEWYNIPCPYVAD